eukprot:s1318_g15.t1
MTSALHKHGDVAAPRKSANGDKSLVIHEDSEEGSFVESAASHVSAALESFDEAVSQGMSALFGSSSSSDEAPVAPKKVDAWRERARLQISKSAYPSISELRSNFAMLDLITIISAAGLQQELKAANGDRSLVINEESEEGSFVESAASQVSAALESFDEAVSQGMSALFGGSSSSEEVPPAPKKVD